MNTAQCRPSSHKATHIAMPLIFLLVGARVDPAAALAAVADRAHQADPLVERRQRLQPVAARIGDPDRGAVVGGRRGLAAAGEREGQRGAQA